jgi:hypothetical protein
VRSAIDISGAFGRVGYERRIKVCAFVLLVLTTLLTNVADFKNIAQLKSSSINQDQVAIHQNRLEELKRALPQRGVIGYVSDEELKPTEY